MSAREELASLKDRVTHLERRVAALEKKPKRDTLVGVGSVGVVARDAQRHIRI